VFTGTPGVFVNLEETIKGLQGIVAGGTTELPEPRSTWSARSGAVAKARKMRRSGLEACPTS